MEILRVENVCKTYHTGETTVNALTDIPFSVQKGEFVAIIGASGSGNPLCYISSAVLIVPHQAKYL